MKKLRTILLAGMLAIATLIPTAGVAQATGNCSVAYVTLSSGLDGNGLFNKYCAGVNDIDISGETATIMGPLTGGNYQPDFDSASSTSGVTSYHLYDAPGGTDYTLCFYINRSYSGLGQFQHESGTYNVVTVYNNQYESFRFVTDGGC